MKEFAGVYRLLFNRAIEWQFYRTIWNARYPENQTTSLRLLTKAFNLFSKNKDNFFLSYVETGTKLKALKDAQISYSTWYEKGLPNLQPDELHISKKRDIPRFSTLSPIRIEEDYIVLPKVGKLRLYEKNYLPKREGVKKASFEFDGKHWWVTVEISSEMTSQQPLVKQEIYVDYNPDGSLVVDNKLFKNIIDSERYKKVKRQKKALAKKYRRQKRNNTVYGRTATVRTSRNMMKTRSKLQQLTSKLDRIKKDYFRKVTCAVAKTKPSKVHVIHENVIKAERQNYLTRRLRESGIREFFSIFTRKMDLNGVTVVKHKNSRKYYETLSSRACGAVKGVGTIQNFTAVKQELVA